MSFNPLRKYSKHLSRPSHSTGIALVSVLWLLLLLSGLAATVAYIARVEALLARRAFDLARAQAAADAAIVNTISRLSDEQAARRPPLGVPQSWDFDGIPTTTRVSNEAGRIDLNAASDELLLNFLQAQGVTEDVASTLVKELRNWQGVGIELLSRIPSAQRPSNLSAAARPNSLTTIGELNQIPGWREQSLNCWIDSLTVYTGQPDVAASDAAPGTLAALRRMQPHPSEGSNVPGFGVAPRSSNDRSVVGEVIRINASANVAGVSTSTEWIGRLTGDISRPTLTMKWEHGRQLGSTECTHP
jgi:general secretion pathway protein K